MIPSFTETRIIEFSETFGKGKRIPVCTRKGRSLIASGQIGIVRIDGRVFVPEPEIERFLRERYIPPRVLIHPAKSITASEIIARAQRGRPRIVKEERS